MVRTYFMALVALLVMVSPNFAQAFGLGEITLKSYLNQPFDAEIEILDRRDLAQNEIIPKLASPEDFSRLGLQRNFFLTRLKFEVIFGEERDYVKVTSIDPVNEPYLDFLVEFLWPEGRLLREYTVLLDPPSYAATLPQKMVPVVQKASQSGTQVQSQKDSVVSSDQSTDVEQNDISVSQPQTASQGIAQTNVETNDRQTSQTRRTISNKDNETLWSIATRERPVESLSVQQTMLAIQKLNPDAFEHENINYLKKNQVLRMPTEEEIRALATRDAMGIVADQNRDWAGKTLAQGGSLPVDTAKLVGSRQVTPMQDEKQSGAQMKLVADSGSEGSAVGTYSGQGNGGIGADESARVLRQNSMLQQDNQSLKSQVETSERLLSLKDQQIAELQARLAAQGVDTSTSVDNEISNNVIERVAIEQQNGSAELDQDTEALQDGSDRGESQVDEQDMVSEEEIQAALAEAQADAQLSGDEGLSFEADQEASEQLSGSESDLETSAQTSSQTTQAGSGGLLGKPMLLAGIALVVLLILGALGFFLYRKRTASSEMAYDLGDNGFDSDINDLDDIGSFPGDELDQFDDEGVSGEDALTEANVYIAHERWDKAIQSLQSAIDSGDESTEVKMKLLEVYAGAGDEQNFKALRADMLTEDSTLEADIDALAASLDGSSSASSQEIDMDATTRMDASDFDLDSGEDEFDISLDDLASDLDASFSSDKDKPDESESTQIIENEGSDLSELEDSLDLSDSFSSSDKLDESVESDESLDLDFDLDDEDDSTSDSDKSEDTAGIADTEIETADEFDLEDTVLLDGSDQNEEDDGLELDLDTLNFDDDDNTTVDSESTLNEKDDSDLELDFSDDDSLGLELDEAGGEAENDKSEETETLSFDSDDDDEFTLDLDDEDEQDFDFGDDGDLDGALDMSEEAEIEDKSQKKPEEEIDASDSDTEDSLFDGASDDEFDLPDEGDEAATKLDLARAYIDMGDEDGAKDILEEVLAEGDDTQKSEAKSLLEKL